MQSSGGGISLPPPMVPNLCIDKKLGVDGPRCGVSFPRIGIGQMVVCAKVRARSFQWTDKVSEKGRQVHKVVYCTGYGDHLQNRPQLTLQYVSNAIRIDSSKKKCPAGFHSCARRTVVRNASRALLANC